MSIPISDLRPQYGKFKLAATGDTEHTLRKISLDDYQWVEDTFGMPMELLFSDGREVRISEVIKLIYHQLEDKSPFVSEVLPKFIDDNGDEHENYRVSGLQKFRKSICGPEEQLAVVQALMKTVGLSQPVASGASTDGKKKESPPKSRAGAKSSTK